MSSNALLRTGRNPKKTMGRNKIWKRYGLQQSDTGFQSERLREHDKRVYIFLKRDIIANWI